MRKTMALVLSMFATACGTVQSASVPIDDEDDAEMNPGDMDTGSGSGSGSGSTETDVEGPAITLAPSTVKDERGDSIDFSTGQPLHTHAGPTVDLAATGCPAVYKYAYLMDASIPFGVNVNPNPLAWHIKVSDANLAVGSQAFRVRTDSGVVVRDWADLPVADANGVSTIELTRKGGTTPVAALGTHTGQFFIDVRARDTRSHETVQSFCFDHHPLQAPVAVGAFQSNTRLYSISFPADWTAASVYTSGGTIDVITQTLTQQTAEPTTVTWSVTSPAFSYTKSTYDGYVVDERAEAFECGTGSTNPKCAMPTSWSAPAQTAGYQTQFGSITPTLSISVVDVDGNTVASSTGSSITLTMPGRATGEGPREYLFVVVTTPLTALQPPAINSPLGDFSLLGLRYTGAMPVSAGTHCVTMYYTTNGWGCARVGYHYRISAIDHVLLKTSFTSRVQQAGVDAPYLSTSTLSSGERAWDSGDDDLPGTY